MPTTESRTAIRAMLYMTLGVFGFCVLDALTKRLTEDYGTWQIIFLSRVVTTTAILLLVTRSHRSIRPLQSRFVKTHLMRSVLVIATTWTFFECLRYIDLADAVAIAFAAPLFMTALSGPLLGEKVGWRRWSAVSIGFIGVIIAVQPSAEGIGYGAFLALCAAATYALLQLWLRPLSGREVSHNIIFYSTLFSGLLAMFPAIAEWRWPDTTGWIIVLAQGSCSTIAQTCMIRAFRQGEASMLAPLEYTGLIWAGLFGYLFWDEIPTLQVIIGACIIIAAAIYIAQREAKKKAG
ncbi:MAG: DMT family transporter [Rhodospirillaceae bacterium]|nr:DMT family transporter [Rhodospirillaceae bacterium]